MSATTTLDDLADHPRWVGWRNESRDDDVTKVPYSPRTGRKAKADNPSTWATRAEAEKWASTYVNGEGGGIGFELGVIGNGIAVGGIDLDSCRYPETGAIAPWALHVLRMLGSPYCEVSPSGTGIKALFLYDPARLPALLQVMGTKGGRKWARGTGKHVPAIELYLTGRYFAITDRRLPDAPVELRHASDETIIRLIRETGPAFVAKPSQSASPPKPDAASDSSEPGENTQAGSEASDDDLLARIERKSTSHPRLRQRWFGDFTGLADQSGSGRAMALGAALRAAGFTFEEMVAALHLNPHTREWAKKKGAANNDREFHRLWAKAEQQNRQQHTAADDKPKDGPGDLAGFDLHEDGLGQAFTAKYQHDLRFCWDAGKWYRWTGNLWQRDRTKIAFSWARKVCRQFAEEGGARDKLKAILGKAATAAAVEKYAQAEAPHSVTSEIWDTDPFLLGTPGGTVDLHTGELREARREDYITKATAVAPAIIPDCTLWLQFLNDACNKDNELIRFLQQFCGYLLTGDTREHALLFIFGPGGNGKSVWLNTVSGILGDYCRIAAMETFTASASDRHPTDLAMLKGARMVCASETEEGRAWAEVRIKQLTGGDTITARFMRRDFFEYRPQFKLVVIGNHKPVLRNIDDAARRRLNIVPFVHKPANPDRELEQKLKAEWPGILRWMIDGCLDWQRNGLVRPQVVVDATTEYFSEQDNVQQWIEECCETGGRNLSDTSEALFKSWSEYALAAGERPGTKTRLTQTLIKHGYEPAKVNGKRGFLRIRVKNVDTSNQWQNRVDRDDQPPF